MIKVIPLKASHVQALKQQGSLTYLTDRVTDDKLLLLEQQPYSFTVLGSSGEILACAGIIEFWEGRGEAWAFFAKSIGAQFLQVHRAVKRFIDAVPMIRIEATVDYDFLAGHKWIRLLGFELECRRMEKYGVGGRDASRYVILRDN